MQTVFKRSGVAPIGEYIPGVYSWPADMLLTEARIDCSPTESGEVRIALEINGTATDYCFSLAPGIITQKLSLPTAVVIPANQTLRFKVVATPDDYALGATLISITASVIVSGSVQAAVNPSLKVGWVNGSEQLDLYNYSTSTHRYTEASTGISTSRATVAADGSSIVLDGSTIFNVTESGIATANLWIDDGRIMLTDDKRIEFKINEVCIGQLTASGFRVNEIVEGAPAYASAAFSFHIPGGAIAVSLDKSGLTCLECAENE